MKLFYWSPFLSNIATVDAVTNSINSLKRYGNKNKYKPFIVDSSGEWQEKLDKASGIDIIKLYNKKLLQIFTKRQFFKKSIITIDYFYLEF